MLLAAFANLLIPLLHDFVRGVKVSEVNRWVITMNFVHYMFNPKWFGAIGEVGFAKQPVGINI